MRQQTGREIFPALANTALPSQRDRDQAQEIFCHPSLLGGDLWA